MDNPQYPTNKQPVIVGVIYVITNTVNGKRYVGQTTKSIEKRWRGHIDSARCGYQYPICNAIRKYGRENFTIAEVVQAETREQLDALERWFILAYNTIKPHGYNLDPGGRTPGELHPETRAKMSKAKKGKPAWNLGKPHSDETKAKISAANRGKLASDSTKAKMRAAQLGNKNALGSHGRLGHKNSEEHNAKVSAARRGKLGTPHTDEFKARMSERFRGNQYGKAQKGRPGRDVSDDERKRISQKLKGRTFSDEHKAKISAALKRYHGRKAKAEQDDETGQHNNPIA